MKRFLALTLALALSLALATTGAGAKTGFADDAQIINGEAVGVLSGIGILVGYENEDGSYSYRPQTTLSRGAGAKIVAYLVLGQTAADKLRAAYTVFKDVDDSVSLAAYIEWAAAQGIVDGYGNGSFGPYDTLTQYAFGKMLLTALGYSSAREGFTGAGWQRNVCALAEKNGVFDGTETSGACDRETAARMALGALQARVVVYSDAAIDGKYYWNSRRVDADSAAIVGDKAFEATSTLGELYGLQRDDTVVDVWGNPGHKWSYAAGGWSETYPEEAVLTYTEAVDECSLLADLGVPVSSDAALTVDKVYYNAKEDDTDIVLQHKADHSACDDKFFGGQGVLTRVYRQADGSYVITEVASYLAQVTSVSGGAAGVTVYYRDLSGFGRTAGQLLTSAAVTEKKASLASSAYAAGEYLLVTVNSAKTGADCIVDHEPVTGVAGQLTGFTMPAATYPGAGDTYVGGAAKKDAFGFSLGYADSKSAANVVSDRVFFYDARGNVIGMTGPEAADGYAVVNEIWRDYIAGDMVVYADVVTMDGVTHSGVRVTTWDGKAVAKFAQTELPVVENKFDNRDQLCYHLYACSADTGGWSLTELQPDEIRILDAISRTSLSGKLSDGTTTVELTARTQFLIRDTEGNYRACTGYASLPVLTAAKAEVIYAAGTANAAVVFIDGAIYDSSRAAGYIVNPAPSGYIQNTDGSQYYVFEVYVDGVARTAYVSAEDKAVIDASGMYELQFALEGGQMVVSAVAKLTASSAGKGYAASAMIDYADCAGDEKISFEGVDGVYDLAGVRVYVVHDTSGAITAGSFADLQNGAEVDIYCDMAEGAIAGLYELYVHTGD